MGTTQQYIGWLVDDPIHGRGTERIEFSGSLPRVGIGWNPVANECEELGFVSSSIGSPRSKSCHHYRLRRSSVNAPGWCYQVDASHEQGVVDATRRGRQNQTRWNKPKQSS